MELKYYSILLNTLRQSLQTTSALSATSKRCFEQPEASFLVCSLIFEEYKIDFYKNNYIKADPEA